MDPEQPSKRRISQERVNAAKELPATYTVTIKGGNATHDLVDDFWGRWGDEVVRMMLRQISHPVIQSIVAKKSLCLWNIVK